ncbi:MAG: substrate-binding domain-containing protein [Desulfosudis oleivorans]|nr:substrate-binding domain-containing protein [Desulfosudis oleivorans]
MWWQMTRLFRLCIPKTKLTNLSIDQLSQIYQGKITNWKEVGGEDLKIVVISRDSSSGTFESWDHFVMKKAKVTPQGADAGFQRSHRYRDCQESVCHWLFRHWLSQQKC